MKKKILLIATIAMMLLCLVACGKDDKKVSVDGYYVFESASHHDYAIEIKGSSVTVYTNGNNYPSEQHGTVEHTETGADLYIVREGTWENQFNDYSPLHVKISEDGTLMYLSSDNSNWTTDTYRKVDKDEFDAVVGRCVGGKTQSEDAGASSDVQATTEGDVVVANDGMAMTMTMEAPDEVATEKTGEEEYGREDFIKEVVCIAVDTYSEICILQDFDFDTYCNEVDMRLQEVWAYNEGNAFITADEQQKLCDIIKNEDELKTMIDYAGGNSDEYGRMLIDYDYIESKIK